MPKRKIIYHQDDEDQNSVYMYLNKKYGLELFINADGFDDAMKIFDICSFENRGLSSWKKSQMLSIKASFTLDNWKIALTR